MTGSGAATAAGIDRVTGPLGPIEILITGQGSPTTVFVPGLAATMAMMRPFGSGVTGTRVFLHLPGQGETALARSVEGVPVAPDYPALAATVEAVVRATGATRAVGVSAGAGALAALLARSGDADGPESPPFDRLVLCLPPPLDGGRAEGTPVESGFAVLAQALETGDVEAAARQLLAHQPPAVRGLPAVRLWSRRHAADLVAGRGNGLGVVLRALPGSPVTEHPDRLRNRCPAVLVLGQEQDPLHAATQPRVWADLFGGEAVVLDAGAIPWRGRDRLRALISGHLNE